VAGRRVVIGVGNEYRRDDGFGPVVVSELDDRKARDDRLRGVDLLISDGEPTRMLLAWEGAELAVVVDVVRGGRDGRWSEFVLPRSAMPGPGAASGHTIELGTTVALARVLGRLPGRLVALVAHGRDFGFGPGLSDAVAAAVAPVADRACALVAAP
jgi:hydrogenase maturation protease